MARFSFRFYHKKRGNRRTGSQALGRVGEAITYSVFLGIGVLSLLIILFGWMIPEWRANYRFAQTTCKTLEKRIGEEPQKDGLLYRPEIHIEYEVQNVAYRTWTYDVGENYSSDRDVAQAVLDRFEIGKEYPCWYDPSDPRVAVLVRQYHWNVYVIASLPVILIFIGGGGLVYFFFHWGRTAEHRAAIRQRLRAMANARANRLGVDRESLPVFPNVPSYSDVTNSPGTRLRYRLPIESSPAWTLLGSAVICVIWNAAVVFMIWGASGAELPDGLLRFGVYAAYALFLGLGVFLTVIFFRQLLITTGIGPTFVEISDYPLHPGKECNLFLSQSGSLTVNALTASLVCVERARYRQGTNLRTEEYEVIRLEIFRRLNFSVLSGIPFEGECVVAVPPGAMHSFKSENNEVNWSLVVEGDVAGWPNFKRSFPIIVYPTAEGARA